MPPPMCAAATSSSRCVGAGSGVAVVSARPPLPHAQRSVRRRAFTLERVDGGGGGGGGGAKPPKPLEFDQPRVVLGSSPAADVQITGDGIEPEHAALTQKGRSVFLTALSGESVFDPSGAFIDGDELRPNVGYVLSSGSVLAFGRGGDGDGDGSARFVVRFEEPTGGGPLAAMLLAGATAGASADVRAAMEDAAKS